MRQMSLSLFALMLIVGTFFSLSKPILASPPTNFETLPVITSGLSNPTALEFAPDGRLFILQQDGTIWIYKNGQLLSQFFDQLPALADSDRGLLGIAFDPDFNTNHYVYFYYINLDSIHTIVRLDASGDIGKNLTQIWTSNEITGSNHAGGTIQFGPDGKLYVSIGDGGNNNAQDLSNIMGKILRINKDGTVPADNPFVGDPNKRPEIWAYGFRNPFRFQFNKLNGDLLAGDVGENTWEELDKVIKGGNYGWPLAEGKCTANCNGLIDPLYTYQHVGSSYSITGGLVYTGDLFPTDYKGSYIFGDYAHGFIKKLTFDQNDNFGGVSDFDNSSGSVVDLKQTPDGSIYYLNIFPPAVFRINYSVGNKTPIPQATASPSAGLQPLTVSFSSAGSTDPDGDSITYNWDFGDGTSSTDPNPTKIYSNTGTFTAFLTVSDASTSAKSFPLTISVGTPPTVDFTSPIASSSYKAGDSINYAITAHDKDGNELPDSQVSFEAVLHHDTHIHPFIRPTTGKAGNFTIPISGEVSANTWYELIATATDNNNLTSTKSIFIYPQKSQFTLNTDPPNLQIALDGRPQSTPVTIDGVVGFKRQIDAIDQKNGDSYVEFGKWSDNGAKRHFIITPDTPTTYTATFKPQTPYTGQYFDNPNFSGNPILTKQDPIISFDWGSGSPDPKIPSDNFSIRWSKQQFFPAGRYKFNASSDDGVRVYMDDNLILDGSSFNFGVSSVVDVSEGTHTLRIDYFENQGGARVSFSYDLAPDGAALTITPTPTPSLSPTPSPTPTPSPISSSSGYTAEYFDNQNLFGPPKLVRNDDQILFDWGSGSPDPSIPPDQFSARWTKIATVSAGIYRFMVVSDDGVRLFIDGQKVIDKWTDQPSTLYSTDQYLTEGPHTIVLEYYEAFGGAVIKFSFSPLPNLFTGEYFDNMILNGSPKLTRLDPKINFVWDFASPDPIIPPDHFSARWTKKLYLKNQEYSYTLKSDDGIRFWVDNTLVVDDWTDHPMKTYTVDILPSAGIHTLKVEYYENSLLAVAILNEDFPPRIPPLTPPIIIP